WDAAWHRRELRKQRFGRKWQRRSAGQQCGDSPECPPRNASIQESRQPMAVQCGLHFRTQVLLILKPAELRFESAAWLFQRNLGGSGAVWLGYNLTNWLGSLDANQLLIESRLEVRQPVGVDP